MVKVLGKNLHYYEQNDVARDKVLKQVTVFVTVAQTRHVIKHILDDFTSCNICSTILQFPPRYYNFLHDFTISSTILQFPPRFYNFLHDFTKWATILATSSTIVYPNWWLHDFTIFDTMHSPSMFLLYMATIYSRQWYGTGTSTILQISPRDITISSTILLCTCMSLTMSHKHMTGIHDHMIISCTSLHFSQMICDRIISWGMLLV